MVFFGIPRRDALLQIQLCIFTFFGRSLNGEEKTHKYLTSSGCDLPSGKLKIAGWKIPIFNRTYIDSIRGPHLPGIRYVRCSRSVGVMVKSYPPGPPFGGCWQLRQYITHTIHGTGIFAYMKTIKKQLYNCR